MGELVGACRTLLFLTCIQDQTSGYKDYAITIVLKGIFLLLVQNFKFSAANWWAETFLQENIVF